MCGMGIIISKKTEGVDFFGEGRVEIHCNREDEHPNCGEHWFKTDEFEIKWVVPEGGIWIA
jgi:hypothetical protein